MSAVPILVILVIIVIIGINYIYRNSEKFSQGAWTQLVAKDPQDSYLTGDAWKYYPNYVYGYPPYDAYGYYPYADPYVNPVVLPAGYPFYSGLRLKKSQHPTL